MTGVVDYAWGQCTWFVSHALTWLGVPQVGALGNAADWVSNAQKRGLPVSSVPVVGSAVVYNASYPGSHGDGHVGVVTAINPNGSFQVASDNWGAPGVTHVGTSTLADVEGFILPPSPSSGIAGAQNALAMAAHGNPSAVTASYHSQGGPDLNPLDIVGNAAVPGLGFLTGGILQGLGFDPSAIGASITAYLQRAFVLIIGVVIVVVGLLVLFRTNPSVNVSLPPPVNPPPPPSKGVRTSFGLGGKSSIKRRAYVKPKAAPRAPAAPAK